MRFMKNEKGIALVMVLILSLISLAIVSAMLYMITQGTQVSGFQKMYRTAEEASLGGAEATAAFIRARGNMVSDDFFGRLSNALLKDDAGSSLNCTDRKLLFSTADWGADCGDDDKTWDPTTNSDLKFDLSDYRVYAKIIDTVQGNSETSGLVGGGGQLGGAGVVASNSAMISPPHIPYLYSMEVQAEAIDNPRERSSVSALYAY